MHPILWAVHSPFPGQSLRALPVPFPVSRDEHIEKLRVADLRRLLERVVVWRGPLAFWLDNASVRSPRDVKDWSKA